GVRGRDQRELGPLAPRPHAVRQSRGPPRSRARGRAGRGSRTAPIAGCARGPAPDFGPRHRERLRVPAHARRRPRQPGPAPVGLSLIHQPGLPDPTGLLRVSYAWPLGPTVERARLSLSYTRALDLLTRPGP